MSNNEQFVLILESFPQQLLTSTALAEDVDLSKSKSIVFCGMGGSGLPGEFVKTIIQKVPVFTIKDYIVPSFVTKESLVFFVSYSGNTEETIAAYEDTKKRGAKMIIVTSGGMLRQIAHRDKIPMLLVPSGLPPRMALGYQTVPILSLLAQNGYLAAIDWKSAAEFLLDRQDEIKSTAQKIAREVGKKIPLIYSSARFYAAAYKWKKNFNENAKMHAFSNYFPEFNHNEINGYDNLNGNYVVFIIRDTDDHPRIKKRMDVVTKIIEDKGVRVISILGKGPDMITRLFWTVWLGDWISYYVTVEHGVDPLDVPVIEELKTSLAKEG